MYYEGKRKVFELKDLELYGGAPELTLPELTTMRCYRPKDGSNYWIYECRPTDRYTGGCPNCGSINYVRHGVYARRVHDVKVGLIHVDINIEIPRYRCRDCPDQSTFNHPLECIVPNRSFTRRAYDQIIHDMFHRTYYEIANDFGCDDKTIRNIFDEVIAHLEASRPPIVAPRVLGIDEKYLDGEPVGKSGRKIARGVFVDIEARDLLEITADNKEETVIKTITSMEGYDTNIQIVTMDMSCGYKKRVNDCLPNARIVVDKFHVFQDLSRKIGSTKKNIMKMLKARIKAETDAARELELRDAYDILCHNSFLFRFGKRKLVEKPHRLPALAQVCELVPEFNHLRLIKEGFERVYEAETREEAATLIAEWMELVPPPQGHSRQVAAWEKRYGISAQEFIDGEMPGFGATVRNWYEEILNYFDPDSRVTNAATESLNGQIQHINEEGYGYSYPHLRAKALYQKQFKDRHIYAVDTQPRRNSHSDNSSFGKMGFAMFDKPVKAITLHCEQCLLDMTMGYYFDRLSDEYFDLTENVVPFDGYITPSGGVTIVWNDD